MQTERIIRELYYALGQVEEAMRRTNQFSEFDDLLMERNMLIDRVKTLEKVQE